MGDRLVRYLHEMDIDIFRESFAYTAVETGFTVSLIEKDYYCSLVLDHFFNGKTELVFKDGTSFSKVHLDFYRLSEDLDFIISVSKKMTKSKRKNKINPVKSLINELATIIPGIVISSDLTGRQYLDMSLLEKRKETKIINQPAIKIKDAGGVTVTF